MSDRLSPREEQIVFLVVAHRMTYREIGAELGISRHTVESHIESIVRRLPGWADTPQKTMARYYRERMHNAA